MVPVVQQLCPPERYRIKCPYTRTPDRIVVHNTGNNAPAINEVTYMINRSDEISFHVAVDDKEIRQAIPFNRNAWASGDGRGPGNMYGIHIEICYSLDDDDPRFTKAEKNAAEYIASLLKTYNWPISKITKHQDYDGKYCPHRTLDLGWQRFLNMVSKYLKEMEPMTYEQFIEYQKKYEKERDAKAASEWAKVVWKKATDAGLFDGTMPQSPFTREQAAMVLDKLGLVDAYADKNKTKG